MSTLREEAAKYQPKETLNIADLEKVSVDVPMESRKFKENTPDEFEIQVALVEGKEYKVPISVIAKMQMLLGVRPDIKFLRVLKKGNGINTSYEVIPLVK